MGRVFSAAGPGPECLAAWPPGGRGQGAGRPCEWGRAGSNMGAAKFNPPAAALLRDRAFTGAQLQAERLIPKYTA